MRSRSSLSRFVGIAFALWFAVFQTEPAVVHACAMHGDASGHGAHGQISVASAAAADSHIGHGTSAADAAKTIPAHDEPDATCTCPGGCATASTVLVPPTSEAVIAEAAIHDAATLRHRSETVRATGADFVRPFANGPPTA
jgi:hypothetical protein